MLEDPFAGHLVGVRNLFQARRHLWEEQAIEDSRVVIAPCCSVLQRMYLFSSVSKRDSVQAIGKVYYFCSRACDLFHRFLGQTVQASKAFLLLDIQVTELASVVLLGKPCPVIACEPRKHRTNVA